MEFFKSIYLFLWGTIKKTFVWVCGLLLAFLNFVQIYIYPTIPEKYQEWISMLFKWDLILFILVAILGAIATYHDLRVKSKKEKWQLEKEKEEIKNARYDELTNRDIAIKKDRAHRVFCQLYKWGEELLRGNAGIEQKQKWDQEILENIGKFCINTCYDNYLRETGRRSIDSTAQSITEEGFNTAMRIVKEMLDDDFPFCLKEN